MKITYLWIQQFGKLKEKEIFLKDGINIIYGPNESGKSTLHGFIKGMLFGLARYRGRASKTDPYSRYEPWDRPVDYAGTMRFQVDDKIFRLERNFYKNDVRESLVCESDGEQLSVSQGDLEMLLGDLRETVYDNTLSIGQLRSETDEGMVRELQNYMSNYEGTGTGDVDVSAAIAVLKKKKRVWEQKKQEIREERQIQSQRIQHQLQYMETEEKSLEDRILTVQKKIQENMQQPVQPQQGERKQEVSEAKRTRPYWLLVPGVLCILVPLFARLSTMFLLVGCMAGLGCMGIFVYLANRKEKQSKPVEKEPALQENPAEKIARWKGQEEALLLQLEEQRIQRDNLQEQWKELQEESSEDRNCEVEIESIQLAMRTLEQLSTGMRQRISQRLQNRIGEILSEITQGKYQQVTLNGEMKVMVYENLRPVSLYQLSRGTVEQIYFALRMAVSEILCEEDLPVLLDDVFAMYDEKRLIQTLQWLGKRNGQTIIFTCHKREMELLERMGVKANIILL